MSLNLKFSLKKSTFSLELLLSNLSSHLATLGHPTNQFQSEVYLLNTLFFKDMLNDCFVLKMNRNIFEIQFI